MRNQSEIYWEMELVKRKIDNKKFKTMLCTMIAIGLIFTYFSWDEFNGLLGHLTGVIVCLFGGFFTYLIAIVIVLPTITCCRNEESKLERLKSEMQETYKAEDDIKKQI